MTALVRRVCWDHGTCFLWDPSRCQCLSVIAKSQSHKTGANGARPSECVAGLTPAPRERTPEGRALCTAMACFRAKDHLEGTKVAVFLRYCAPKHDQSGRAGPPKSGDQEGDGRLGCPKRSRRPTEMAADGCVVKAFHGVLHEVTGSGVRER